MFGSVVRLELRKQRRNALSVLLVIAIFLAVALGIGLYRRHADPDLLPGLLAAFALGIPIVAVCTGAPVAAALRSQRKAEEMLPFHPVSRLVGAYLVSHLYFLAISAGMLAVGFPNEDLHRDFTIARLALAVLQLHFLAFFISYWLNQAFLGGALAALLVGGELFLSFTMVRFAQQVPGPYELMLSRSWALAAIVALILGGIATVPMLSRRLEREKPAGLWMGSVIAVFLIAPLLVIGMSVAYSVRQLTARLVFIDQDRRMSDVLDPLNLPALQPGVLMRTFSGKLVLINGRQRQLLVSEDLDVLPDLAASSGSSIGNRNYDFRRTWDGEIWVLLQESNASASNSVAMEVWSGKPGNSFARVADLTTRGFTHCFFGQRAESLVLYAVTGKRELLFARIEERPPWKWNLVKVMEDSDMAWHESVQDQVEAGAEGGRVAVISMQDHQLVKRLPGGGERRWPIPAFPYPRIYGPYALPVSALSADPTFALELQKGSASELVLFAPDGSVRTVLTAVGHGISEWIIPGGGTAWIGGGRLIVFENGGAVHGPFDATGMPSFPRMLRLSGDELWFCQGARLLKRDLKTGRQSLDVRFLPPDIEEELGNGPQFVPAQEGIYFIRDHQICLVYWNGKIRQLGPDRV